jgi:hypothetical protein
MGQHSCKCFRGYWHLSGKFASRSERILAEVGKVTLKINGNEALSDESVEKVMTMKR